MYWKYKSVVGNLFNFIKSIVQADGTKLQLPMSNSYIYLNFRLRPLTANKVTVVVVRKGRKWYICGQFSNRTSSFVKIIAAHSIRIIHLNPKFCCKNGVKKISFCSVLPFFGCLVNQVQIIHVQLSSILRRFCHEQYFLILTSNFRLQTLEILPTD